MSRVRITEPKEYLFSVNIEVRVTDLNYGNHLANEKVLVFAQEARVQFLRSHGKSEVDFWGTSLIQGDAAISYQNEGFLANRIRVDVGIDNVSNSSFDFVYRMYNETTDKPLAMVKTRMVCFDYDVRKVTPVPQGFTALSL